MDMLEWIGESVNPGSVGSVELGGEIRPSGAKWPEVALQLALSGLFVGVGLWVVFGSPLHVARTSHNLTVAAVVLFSYVGLAWLIRPRPDMSNLGWAGGAFDNPFRYSDDLNRSLLFFSIALWPGRFVADTLVETLGLLFGGGGAARATPARVGPRAAPRTTPPKFQVRGTRGRW